jgi:LmbE family N-acetylglucosaminyl deacetylase
MLLDLNAFGRNLFTAMFSDEPLPDVEAAIVVAHPGDESMSASWLMVRLQERASVFCLTKGGGATRQAARFAGVPADNCHNLGMSEDELAGDLEHLVWLTTAAVTTLQPHVLVTHACEGHNLNHDATAFAVHMTARLLTRTGGGVPLVVEFPHGSTPATPVEESVAALSARHAVRVEFGPESRKVKRRMLQCHGDERLSLDRDLLLSESYFLAITGNALDTLGGASGTYLDAPWCSVDDFKREARKVAGMLNRAVLSSPSRV